MSKLSMSIHTDTKLQGLYLVPSRTLNVLDIISSEDKKLQLHIPRNRASSDEYNKIGSDHPKMRSGLRVEFMGRRYTFSFLQESDHEWGEGGKAFYTTTLSNDEGSVFMSSSEATYISPVERRNTILFSSQDRLASKIVKIAQTNSEK
jgi:hypothetical protein